MSGIFFASVFAFTITFIAGALVIPVLTRLRFGQTVREDGPLRHLTKSGTPTMGGVIFLPTIAIVTLAFTGFDGRILVAVLCMLGFGVIGFIDDYIKTSLKRSLGLRANQKLLLQLALAWALSYYAIGFASGDTSIMMPILNSEIDLELLFMPFTIFMVVATVNSVNIADGLDGLVAGIMAIICFFLTIMMSNMGLTNLSFFSSSVIGGCLGFLVYNLHPAKIFMGDTGSLGLGGALSALLVLSKTQIYMLILGMIFVLEALSVVIQVIFFRISGKRFFRMSPIHHHFELMGWSESRVVYVFWGFTLITCALGYYLFYI